MSEGSEMNIQTKVLMQQNAMFHAVFSLLRDLDSEKTETILKQTIANCEKNGYGADFPEAILKAMYPQHRD